MTTQPNLRFLAALTSGLLLTTAVAVNAGGMSETRVETRAAQYHTEQVSLADLDLASAEGQEVLHNRLQRAARRVCGSVELRIAGSARQMGKNQACYEDALAAAVKQVSAGQVADISL